MLFASDQQVNAATTLLFTKSKMGSTWQRERLNLFVPIALICCIQLIQICSAQEAQQPWYENLPAVAMDYKVMYRYFYTRPRSNAMLTIKQQLQLFCVYLIKYLSYTSHRCTLMPAKRIVIISTCRLVPPSMSRSV